MRASLVGDQCIRTIDQDAHGVDADADGSGVAVRGHARHCAGVRDPEIGVGIERQVARRSDFRDRGGHAPRIEARYRAGAEVRDVKPALAIKGQSLWAHDSGVIRRDVACGIQFEYTAGPVVRCGKTAVRATRNALQRGAGDCRVGCRPSAVPPQDRAVGGAEQFAAGHRKVTHVEKPLLDGVATRRHCIQPPALVDESQCVAIPHHGAWPVETVQPRHRRARAIVGVELLAATEAQGQLASAVACQPGRSDAFLQQLHRATRRVDGVNAVVVGAHQKLTGSVCTDRVDVFG